MKRLLAIAAAIIMLISAGTAPAAAQERPDTVVSLVTIYPGSDIYELEGHSALRLRMPGGADIAVNFGLFDFDSPNFVYRFVSGQTDYMAGAMPWQPFLDSYRRQGRRVIEQELDLDSTQKARLIELTAENLRPENRTYRYNYVLDNCATRPLRLIELAVGDSIMLGPGPDEAQSSLPVTFRNSMRRYHRNYPWYQFGIDLALGSGIDRPISRREESFAPATLAVQMASATAGGRRLVGATNVLADFSEDNAVLAPTPWYLTPEAVFTIILVLGAALSIADLRRGAYGTLSRVFDTVFFGVLGLTGCVLTFLIFVSVHEATSPNWLYVWLNPLCMIPAIFLWLKKGKCVLICYQIINFAVLLIFVAVWPFLPQSANPAFLPIILTEMLRSATYVRLTATASRRNKR